MFWGASVVLVGYSFRIALLDWFGNTPGRGGAVSLEDLALTQACGEPKEIARASSGTL